ncbi:hypothetical protein NH340_JMT05423 [Sarcoptes scabiei]|nr:hypothetical protein NH340_JMT05423 [Sarcoptes scabiei]
MLTKTLLLCVIVGVWIQVDFFDPIHGNLHDIQQCLMKIVDEVQPCSENAINNWNLNHSFFVPSRMSVCCANWEVYECFIQAALNSCTLYEFQSIVNNMTADALYLQRDNCSRYRYHSDVCQSFNRSGKLFDNNSTLTTMMIVSIVLIISLLKNIIFINHCIAYSL